LIAFAQQFVQRFGNARNARRYNRARLIFRRMDGANRSVASPRKRIASARQFGASRTTGHASALSMWINA
jgi:hypothetical protein